MTTEEKIEEIGTHKPINFISESDLCAYQQGLERGAREMAEWIESQLLKDNIEDELERFAYSLPRSADGFWPKDIDPKSVEARTKYGVHHAWSYEQVKKIARHFANWQKEQMMQKAVEATVCEMSEQHGRMVCAWFGCKTEEYYDLDDEVKIIIIKEEEK